MSGLMRARASRYKRRRTVFTDVNIVMLGGEIAGIVSFWRQQKGRSAGASFKLHVRSKKRDGQRSEVWISVRCFGRDLVAKLAELNLARGDLVTVQGTWSAAPRRYRSCGEQHFFSYINADDVNLFDRSLDDDRQSRREDDELQEDSIKVI